MEWQENTKNFDKLMSTMTALASKEVKVGFFDTRYGDDNDNLYVAQVAQWQEEGHKDGAKFAPPRPFFRDAFWQKVRSNTYTQAYGRELAKVANFQLTPHAFCKKLGEGLKTELAHTIDVGAFAPNSQEWAEHKQKMYGVFLTPLTYTGFMQESVDYRITNKGQQ